MRVKGSFSSVLPGGIRAGLILAAILLGLLMASPRSSVAAVGVQGFPVATAQENETSVAVDGNTAVWTGGSDIRGKNLATGQALGLPADQPGTQGHPSVDGRFVVWEETVSNNTDVYGYDLVSKEEFPVAAGPGDQTGPVVDGNLVVWEDDRSGNADVYAYNLDTRQEQPVVTGPGQQAAPDVEGETVVWEDRDAQDSDVVAMDLGTGEPSKQEVASGDNWQSSPAVGNGTVVWQEERLIGDYDVLGYDLTEDRRLEIAGGPDEPGDQLSPTVGGRAVAWEHSAGGRSDVRGKDLTTGEVFVPAGGPADEKNPAASGDAVVWQVQRSGEDNFGSYDLYGARLDLAPLAPTGLTAKGSAGGVGLDWTSNSEADLVGYNVYRAGSEGGNYTKLNTRVLSGSSFEDPAAPKGARSFYEVRAVDAAGSESAAARASAVAPRETAVSLSASSSQLDFSEATVTLSGRLTSGAEGLPGKTVNLLQRPEGETTWKPVTGGQATTDPGGGFTVAVPGVDRDTDYRAEFAGTEDALPSKTSAPAAVDVKTTISVSATRVVSVKRPVTISGLVLPNRTGEVALTIKRGGVKVAGLTAQVSSNTFSARYTPNAVGAYEVVASFGVGPDDANTTSTSQFTVKRKIRR